MKTVLIVDDDPGIRQLYRDILEEDAYQALEAEGANTALLILKTRDVDLVILDIRMPGIHGLQLLDMLRTMYPRLPVIICSAVGDLLNKYGVWDEGGQVVGLFEKPVEAQALIRCVDEAFGGFGPSCVPCSSH